MKLADLDMHITVGPEEPLRRWIEFEDGRLFLGEGWHVETDDPAGAKVSWSEGDPRA